MGTDNGLAPIRCQGITWTNAVLLSSKYFRIIICIIAVAYEFIETLGLRENGCHITNDIFRCISLNENFQIWKKKKFTEICSLGFDWQYGSIGSDNGLAPNRRLAINWSKDGMSYWCKYASLGLNELTHCVLVTSYGDRDLGQHWLR